MLHCAASLHQCQQVHAVILRKLQSRVGIDSLPAKQETANYP